MLKEVMYFNHSIKSKNILAFIQCSIIAIHQMLNLPIQ